MHGSMNIKFIAYVFVTCLNAGNFEDRLKCNDLLYKFQQLY
jgi:hypothetical protein